MQLHSIDAARWDLLVPAVDDPILSLEVPVRSDHPGQHGAVRHPGSNAHLEVVGEPELES